MEATAKYWITAMSRMVKKSKTPAGERSLHRAEGRVLIVFTGRCCSLRWVEGGVCLRGGIDLGFGANRHG